MQPGGIAASRAASDGPTRSVGCRLLELILWLVVGVAGCLVLTQAVGWDGTRLVAMAQALTPYVVMALVPIAGVASWRRRDALAVVAGTIGLGGVLLASPLVLTPSNGAMRPDAVGLRVASVNLYYGNPRVADAATAIEALDADVLVFSEYTAEHQQTLDGTALAQEFPFHIDRDGLNAGGVALWSRYPLTDGPRPATVNYSLDVVVAGPDGDVRVLAVHPPTPVYDFDGWTHDLDLIGRVASTADVPTLIVGDFNASYWHPAFRRLLTTGFVDAHMAAGRGWSTSWPTDRAFPPFVQLDHALTGAGLTSADVHNVAVPGSDHRGLMVTVAPTR